MSDGTADDTEEVADSKLVVVDGVDSVDEPSMKRKQK